MPELSRFHGLIITMYHNEHGASHFHVRYAEYKATIEVESDRVNGAIPSRVVRLALDWCRLHRAGLLDNWRRAEAGAPLRRIRPLE